MLDLSNKLSLSLNVDLASSKTDAYCSILRLSYYKVSSSEFPGLTLISLAYISFCCFLVSDFRKYLYDWRSDMLRSF